MLKVVLTAKKPKFGICQKIFSTTIVDIIKRTNPSHLFQKSTRTGKSACGWDRNKKQSQTTI
jgi:hypothetical protein